MRDKQHKLQRQLEQGSGQNNQSQNMYQLGQINYDDFTKSELVRHLKSKDKIISDLKQTFKNQSKGDKDKINMYRVKLEQQILHNQKAVKSFETITQTVVKIITKYQSIDPSTRQTLKNAVQGIRETCNKANKSQGNIENQQQQDQQEFSCIQEIVTETSKLLDYLSRLTDENVQIVVRLRDELARTRDQLAKVSPYGQFTKREPNQQIRSLKQQVNSLVLDNNNLNKLLEQNEYQKNKLLLSICTILTDQTIEQLRKLPISDLIQQIKRLTYRIKQLQSDKQQIFKKSKSQKQQNQQRLNELLKQVKQVRTTNKHSSSRL